MFTCEAWSIITSDLGHSHALHCGTVHWVLWEDSADQNSNFVLPVLPQRNTNHKIWVKLKDQKEGRKILMKAHLSACLAPRQNKSLVKKAETVQLQQKGLQLENPRLLKLELGLWRVLGEVCIPASMLISWVKHRRSLHCFPMAFPGAERCSVTQLFVSGWDYFCLRALVSAYCNEVICTPYRRQTNRNKAWTCEGCVYSLGSVYSLWQLRTLRCFDRCFQ